MTEKKIEAGDLQKALQTLQDLAKGHNSRGTATTEVVGMVSESGATQVFHTPNNSDPRSWAGSTGADEDWSDSIGPDGTDYKAAGAKMRKSVMAKIAKGIPLTKGEKNFVAKGGLDKFKDMKSKDKDMDKAMDKDEDEAKKAYGSDDKDMEKAQDEDEDEHEDEAEDKKMVREMIKPSAMKKKKDMSKSFVDHASENEAVRGGFEVSEFLAGFAQVMHKSLASMESRITDRVISALAHSAADQGEVSKSMAEALANLGEVLAAQAQRLDQVESGPARGSKSATVAKSISGYAESSEPLNKSQVTSALVELVQKGQATTQDVLKYDATGELSTDLRAKVVGRR